MATSLDMSLDELIKNNKQQQQFNGGRGRGRGRGRGGLRGGTRGGGFGRGRRNPLRVNRASPYSIAKSFSLAKDVVWQHDMFENSMAALGMPVGPEAGAKLYISNLDFGVTNSDIKELFSEVGELKRCTVHYDRSGRSNGTAEVVYINMSDAIAAVKRYNNVQLDGKPMKLEIIGTNLTLPVSARVNFPGRGRKTVVMTPGFTRAAADASIEQRSSNGWNRGRGTGSRHFRGRGRGRRGRGRSQGPEKSAAELDKELETYHTEAMQTS